MCICMYTHICNNALFFAFLNDGTAILIIIEGHETAFYGFAYQFTTGKPFQNMKPNLNYYENGSSIYDIIYTGQLITVTMVQILEIFAKSALLNFANESMTYCYSHNS